MLGAGSPAFRNVVSESPKSVWRHPRHDVARTAMHSMRRVTAARYQCTAPTVPLKARRRRPDGSCEESHDTPDGNKRQNEAANCCSRVCRLGAELYPNCGKRNVLQTRAACAENLLQSFGFGSRSTPSTSPESHTKAATTWHIAHSRSPAPERGGRRKIPASRRAAPKVD